MKGGANNVRIGHRKLRTYTMGTNENSHSELSRLVSSQASAIHDRVIESIMELRKVDRDEAKVIKAAIYHNIKQEQPHLSNLDRAIEMQNNVTNEYIDALDLESTRKALEKHYAGKDDKKDGDERKNKKDKKDKKVRKSKKEEFSATSKSE